VQQDVLTGLQPTDHYEDVETKRRLNNIIHVSGLIDSLTLLKARAATHKELCLVHTPQHVEFVQVSARPGLCFGSLRLPGGLRSARWC
jgi:acetoin utilization deacetylase AcuC-like enzyme